jgi:parallel beta-helix repeat protein
MLFRRRLTLLGVLLLFVTLFWLPSAGAADATRVLMLGNPETSVQPGQNLTLAMRFDAAPMDEDYEVFVHFIDANGQHHSALNGDHSPPRPTSTWSGAVSYDHTVSIPPDTPAGQYSVRVGLYQNHSPWDRVALAQGDGVTVDDQLRYTVGKVTVSTASSSDSRYHLYVATTGSDSNPGTQAQPFRTMAKASQVAQPDTTVHVAAGTYPGDFTTTASGTETGRIRYVSDVEWGAKIVPAATSGSRIAWNNKGNYVDIVGFEVNGTGHQSGTKWWNGIVTFGSYTRITGNRVHHIATSADDCTNNGGSGINASNYEHGYHVDIVGNVVHDIGTVSCNFIQGIYMATKGTVKNNVVHHVGAWGIHLWHDARNIDIANNTVVHNGNGIIVGGGDNYHLAGPCDYVNVSNNIVYGNTQGIAEQGNFGTHNTYTNNLSYGNSLHNYNLRNPHTQDVTGDPQFMDLASANYRLRSGSPALDKGSATYAPAADIEQIPRPQGAGFDLGAYERPSWFASARSSDN